MTLNIQMNTKRTELAPEVMERIEHHVLQLDERLVHFAEPNAVLRILEEGTPRRFAIDLRVETGSRSGDLISHQSAPTADHAVRLAVEDIERQLERLLSTMRGEPSFGVPSRRLPKDLRPSTRDAESEASDAGAPTITESD